MKEDECGEFQPFDTLQIRLIESDKFRKFGSLRFAYCWSDMITNYTTGGDRYLTLFVSTLFVLRSEGNPKSTLIIYCFFKITP